MLTGRLGEGTATEVATGAALEEGLCLQRPLEPRFLLLAASALCAWGRRLRGLPPACESALAGVAFRVVVARRATLVNASKFINLNAMLRKLVAVSDDEQYK